MPAVSPSGPRPAVRDAHDTSRRIWAAVAVGGALVGAACLVGCLLAIRLELDGLGRPRDSAPRVGYLALLWAGVAASVVIPAWLARKGLGSRWWIVAGPMLLMVVVVWLLLGV